jgi:hypothetical protein
MEPRRTCFRDGSENDIGHIVVIESGDDELRITEQRDDEWCKPYWIPEDQFTVNTHGDSVERLGRVSSNQFEQITELAEA